MSQKIASVFTYMIAGYVLGLLLGFTLFDPDTDMYALLGAIGGISGIFIGLIPFFRRQIGVALMSIVGFYLASLVAILLFGQPKTDDLLEVLQRGGASLRLVLAGTLVGSGMGWRLSPERFQLAAAGFIAGGFVGGAVFGVMLGLAPYQSMVGWSPSVILCSLLWGGLLLYAQSSRQAAAIL